MANLPTDAVLIKGSAKQNGTDIFIVDWDNMIDGETGKSGSQTKTEKVTYTPVKYGERGENVKIMQKYLLDKKYSLGSYGVDGIFGDYTLAAVRKFQSDNKLKVTGVWDQQTQEFIANQANTTTSSDALIGESKKDPKPTLTIKDSKTIIVTGEDGKKYKFTFNSGVPAKISGIGKLSKTYTKKFTMEQIQAIRAASIEANNKYANTKWRSTLDKRLDSHGGTLPKRPAVGQLSAVYFTTSSKESGQNAQSVGSSDTNFGRYTAADELQKVEEAPEVDEETDVPFVGGTDPNAKQDDIDKNELKTNFGSGYYAKYKIVQSNENTIAKLSDPINGLGIKTFNSSDGSGLSLLNQLYGDGKVRDSIIHALGLYEGSYSQLLERNALYYNRFKMAIPDSQLQRSFAHVFFVKPSCNIVYNDKGPIQIDELHDSDFTYIGTQAPYLLKELTNNVGNQDNDFSMVLSNAAASFSLQDEYIDTDSYGKSYLGYKIAFGRHDSESKTAGEFTITFQDDRNSDIFKLLHMWVHYISGTFRGRFQAKQETIDEHIMDYAGAVYYILTAEDGETILFWSKYYGVFPSTIPSTQYSWSRGTLLSSPPLDVTFKFSFKEDFNVDALVEFNKNANVADYVTNGQVPYEKTYDKELGSIGKTWTGAPFIETFWNDGSVEYKLRFKKSDSD